MLIGDEMKMTQPARTTAWMRFWRTGGWWRALLLVIVYYGLYQAGSLLFLPFLNEDESPALTIFIGTALPIALGVVILVGFGLSTGLLREVLGQQPVRGSGWMWVAVAAVLLFNILRFASIDYDATGLETLLAWLVTGLFIGIAEELLTRGYVINLMRRGGHRELTVAAVSAALFSALHTGNLLAGQSLLATLLQLIYTFAFGICMYLALRVTGTILWPILLHATTDPSIFLMTEHPTEGALSIFAGLGNIAVIAVGLILLIFIRGQAQSTKIVINGSPHSDK